MVDTSESHSICRECPKLNKTLFAAWKNRTGTWFWFCRGDSGDLGKARRWGSGWGTGSSTGCLRREEEDDSLDLRSERGGSVGTSLQSGSCELGPLCPSGRTRSWQSDRRGKSSGLCEGPGVVRPQSTSQEEDVCSADSPLGSTLHTRDHIRGSWVWGWRHLGQSKDWGGGVGPHLCCSDVIYGAVLINYSR